MDHMFYGCTNLKELCVSDFADNEEINMSGMFEQCTCKIKRKIKKK